MSPENVKSFGLLQYFVFRYFFLISLGPSILKYNEIHHQWVRPLLHNKHSLSLRGVLHVYHDMHVSTMSEGDDGLMYDN